jgi:hypothetical protein
MTAVAYGVKNVLSPEGAMGFLARRRAVAAARRLLMDTADRIQARSGTVLRERSSGNGGLAGPPGLGIITLRPGDAETIFAEAIDSAVDAGYARPPVPPNGYGRGCRFPSIMGFPELSVEVIPAGERFRGLGETVPSGHTGVIVSLHKHLG